MEVKSKEYKIGDIVTINSGSLCLKIEVTGKRTGKYGLPAFEGFINGDKTAPVWTYDSQIIEIIPKNK